MVEKQITDRTRQTEAFRAKVIRLIRNTKLSDDEKRRRFFSALVGSVSVEIGDKLREVLENDSDYLNRFRINDLVIRDDSSWRQTIKVHDLTNRILTEIKELVGPNLHDHTYVTKLTQPPTPAATPTQVNELVRALAKVLREGGIREPRTVAQVLVNAKNREKVFSGLHRVHREWKTNGEWN